MYKYTMRAACRLTALALAIPAALGGGAAAAALHLIALARRFHGRSVRSDRRPARDRDPLRLAGDLDGTTRS